MSALKAAKGWAVIGPKGKIICANINRGRAIHEACDVHWRGWSDDLWRDMRAAGYRCLPCTITVTEEPK